MRKVKLNPSDLVGDHMINSMMNSTGRYESMGVDFEKNPIFLDKATQEAISVAKDITLQNLIQFIITEAYDTAERESRLQYQSELKALLGIK